MIPATPDLLEAIVASTRHDLQIRRAARSYEALEQAARQAATPRGAAFEAALKRPGAINDRPGRTSSSLKGRSPPRASRRADSSSI